MTAPRQAKTSFLDTLYFSRLNDTATAFVFVSCLALNAASQSAADTPNVRTSGLVTFTFDEDRASFLLHLGAAGQSGAVAWSIAGKHLSYSDNINDRWDMDATVQLQVYDGDAGRSVVALQAHQHRLYRIGIWQRSKTLKYNHSYQISPNTVIGGALSVERSNGPGLATDFDQHSVIASITTTLGDLSVAVQAGYRVINFDSGLKELVDHYEVKLSHPLGKRSVATLHLSDDEGVYTFPVRDVYRREYKHVAEARLGITTRLFKKTNFSTFLSYRERKFRDVESLNRRTGVELSHNFNDNINALAFAELSEYSDNGLGYNDHSIGFQLTTSF